MTPLPDMSCYRLVEVANEYPESSVLYAIKDKGKKAAMIELIEFKSWADKNEQVSIPSKGEEVID